MNDSHMDRDHIRLVTRGCPGACCDDDRNMYRFIYWKHICGNNAYLDRHGNVHCFKCNTQYSILDAFFDCQNSQQFGIPGYIGSNIESNIDTKKYKICEHLRISRMLNSCLSVDEKERKNICNFDRRELFGFFEDVSDSIFCH